MRDKKTQGIQATPTNYLSRLTVPEGRLEAKSILSVSFCDVSSSVLRRTNAKWPEKG